MTNAYYLSHLGKGDNVLNIGAVIFLSKYYKTIYFCCAHTNSEHIKYIVENYDTKNIKIVTIETDNGAYETEIKKFGEFLIEKSKNCDIYTSGSHKYNPCSKISNERVLNVLNDMEKNNFKKYNFPSFLNFGVNFYRDNNLDPSIMIDYFNIKTDDEPIKIYEKISNFKIIFCHTETSQSIINLNDKIIKFVNDEKYIVICPNKNFYDENHPKYNLAKEFIKLPTIFHYTEIIKNAEQIHVVDTCLSCLSICLKLKKETKCSIFKIYDRFNATEIVSFVE